jgi:hypothetical protein
MINAGMRLDKLPETFHVNRRELLHGYQLSTFENGQFFIRVAQVDHQILHAAKVRIY